MLLALHGIPEAPNILTFFHDYFTNSRVISFLYHWQNIFFSLVTALFLIAVFYLGSQRRDLIPSSFQNFLEWLVETFRNFIVAILGPDGEKFVPFLGTLFIYILTMNLMGLIPLLKSASSSINVTLALAICVFCYVQYLQIKNMGFWGLMHHLAGSPKTGAEWLIAPLMFPIELITQLSRPITLALRLFGNILGEKILIGYFAMAGATLFYFLPLQTPFMFLGLLTAVMQAMVFTLLSTIYILLSMPSEKH